MKQFFICVYAVSLAVQGMWFQEIIKNLCFKKGTQ
jgi:hypothetical protein